jgi:hypothetical protein
MSTAFVSQNLTAGQLNAIVKMLGGEDGAMRFLRGELVVREPSSAEFTVWKTITLGNGIKDADGMRQAMKDNGMRISEWASTIMAQNEFIISPDSVEVDLVRMSVAKVGFKDCAHYNRICKVAQMRGLHLCPAEVGPQLRLQYTDQPTDEWVVVAMKAIDGSDGDPSIFIVAQDVSSLWLYADCDIPQGIFRDDSLEFVFVRPRN